MIGNCTKDFLKRGRRCFLLFMRTAFTKYVLSYMISDQVGDCL